VAAIVEAGGDVGYDWQRTASGNLSDLIKSVAQPPTAFAGRVVWPRWLVNLLGVDAFGRVDKVWFARGPREISGQLLAQVGRLRHLEILCVHRQSLLDTTSLDQLKELTELRDLRLQVRAKGPPVDLSGLQDMRRLELLHLGSIPVRDDDLIHLRPLTNLRALVFRSPYITDAGLFHLSGLTRLECLILNHASVRGQGLAHLRTLVSLETLAMLRSKVESLNDLPAIPIKNLCLPFSRIDDRGLARVRPMPALDLVYLDESIITDTGLASLTSQQTLRDLHVNGTGVTASGVRDFRTKKPRTAVECDPIQKSPYFSIQ
jgi:hypothetical protein